MTMEGWLYDSGGEPIGYVRSGCLYRTEGSFIGPVEEDGACWHFNGTFIGTIVDGDRLLRRPKDDRPSRPATEEFPGRGAPGSPGVKPSYPLRRGWKDVEIDL